MNPSGPRQIRQLLHPKINQEALDSMTVTVIPGAFTGRQATSEEKLPLKQNAMKFSKVRYDVKVHIKIKDSNIAFIVKDTRANSASATKKLIK